MSEKITVVVVHLEDAPLARALLEKTQAVTVEGIPFRVFPSPYVPENTVFLIPGEVDGDEVRPETPPPPTEIVVDPDGFERSMAAAQAEIEEALLARYLVGPGYYLDPDRPGRFPFIAAP